jgi:hypothetical protein
MKSEDSSEGKFQLKGNREAKVLLPFILIPMKYGRTTLSYLFSISF